MRVPKTRHLVPMCYSTFPCHHVQDAGLQKDSVAFGRRERHGLGRLEQMQHVGLRTEVKLRFLLLHINVNTVDTAPYSLGAEGGKEKKAETSEVHTRTDLISSHGKLTDLCVVCSSAFTANLNLISLHNVAGRDNLHSFLEGGGEKCLQRRLGN